MASTPALEPSSPAWLACVLDNFPSFLSDHASAEKKASGMALNVASHYPDRPRLLLAMAELAAEEMTHYREVIRVMTELGLAPLPDQKDPYVRTLNSAIRRGSEEFLLDRLLVGAVIERRGHERFGLIAQAFTSSPNRPYASLGKFYQAIAESEGRHWTQFVDLAEYEYGSCAAVSQRLRELSALEAELISQQPLRAALH